MLSVATTPLQPSSAVPEHAIHQINLAWLLKLRWGAIVGQSATILYVDQVMRMSLPLGALFGIVGVELVSNIAALLWSKRHNNVNEWLVGLLMLLDVVLLSGLFYFTGGPFNPFNFLYLVHIALSASVLRARWTWLLAGLSFACFGALFIEHAWLGWADHPEQHGAHLRMHLQGMWVAFGVAAVFIAYFVSRVSADLSRHKEELAQARQLALRSEKLASLATLSTGAAHELATPLSTIAVVAKELERELERLNTKSHAIEDARLIRQEVDRCRNILQQMAADAGQSFGDGFSELSLEQIVQMAQEGFSQPERLRFGFDAEIITQKVYVPARAVAQALRGVMKNAQQASKPDSPIELVAAQTEAAYELIVRDFGSGMSKETLARAGEPFFTTKEPGQGMGLGLFLTRAVFERLGGELRLDSIAGKGTTVVLSLPKRG